MELTFKKMNVSRLGVNAVLAAAAVVATSLFGEITKLHEVLFLVMALDYLSGVAAAISLKKLSSFKAHVGILKKFAVLGLVAFSYHIGLLMNTEVLCTGVIAFFIANEFISVAENYKILGLPIPEKLSKAIEVLGDKSNNAAKKDGV